MSSNTAIVDHEANKTEWRQEEILKLANHFHAFCEETSQHKRVHHFQMSQDDVERFTEVEVIDTLKISLAIEASEAKTNFSFYPLLEITEPDIDTVLYFPLAPTAISDDSVAPLSEIVPGVFKEMVLDNWNKLDSAYIDDLFIAQAWDSENNQALSQMVRVHEFQFTDEMTSFLDNLNTKDDDGVANITNIKLYPGVDMNKFGNTELISFTPVLSFKHRNSTSKIQSHPGNIEELEYETLVEYCLPCPPCRKKKHS